MRCRQRGVALITALLIVAIATVVAVEMASRQHYDIRRTGNLLQADQAWLYVQGIEAWAGQILRRDREEGMLDHGGEDWAQMLPPIPVDGGQVSGKIDDLQGRFNVNNLLRHDGQIDAAAVQQFERLLQVLSLEPVLAHTLADWLDVDIEPRFPGGAEDDLYLGKQPPYRAANGPMASVSELRLLHGMDAQSYAALLPHVAALPERTKVNVNTASPAVLMSLHPDLGEMDAEQLIAARGDKGYAELTEFLQHPALAGLELEIGLLGVESHYFLLRAQVWYGRIAMDYSSLLVRDQQAKVWVMQRSQGVL